MPLPDALFERRGWIDPMTKIRSLGHFTAGFGLACALVAIGLVATRPGRARAPAGRYTIDTGIIVDNRTELNWQAVAPDTMYTWSGAVTYCKNLRLGGSSSWRLPSVGELQTLVDDSRATPSVDPAFAGTPVDQDSWTSSNVAGFGSTYAYAVSFQYGSTSFHFWSDSLHVRCVDSSQ